MLIRYSCQKCGAEDRRQDGGFDCPACGQKGSLRGHAPATSSQSSVYWAKPKPIHALRPDHPDHWAHSREDAQRKLERNGLWTHPADDSGVQSPCGTAKEATRPLAFEVGAPAIDPPNPDRGRKIRTSRSGRS